MARRAVALRDGERLHRVTVEDDRTVVIEGEPVTLAGGAHGLFRVGTAPVRTAWATVSGGTCWVFVDGDVHTFEIEREEARRKGAARHHGTLMAPMPGTVVRVETEVGATVTRGATLVILEAMKMELPIRATSDGVVTAVNCRVGELVQPGKSLIEIG
jgi:biotin carboxyl carrier protein